MVKPNHKGKGRQQMGKQRILHVINWIGDRGSEKTCLNYAKQCTEFEHLFLARAILSEEALVNFSAAGSIYMDEDRGTGDFFEYTMLNDAFVKQHNIDLVIIYLPGDDVPKYVKKLSCKKILHVLCTKKCNLNGTHFDAVTVPSKYAASLNPNLNPEFVYPVVERIEPVDTKERLLKRYFPEAQEGTMIVSRIGSIETCKHPEDFLKVAEMLQHVKNIVFLIAGIGNPGYTNNLFSKYNLPNVVFAGRVSEKEKANINAASVACLYPTEFEAFGYSLAEPMSHDVPVITYNESACPETIGDGGKAVEFNNLTQLSQALVNIVTRPTHRKKLGEKARQRWAENFAPDSSSKKMAEIYKRVLNVESKN